MTLPVWLRRLPHNLSTIRVRIGVELFVRDWRFHLLRIDSQFDPGDATYWRHLHHWTLDAWVGPVRVVILELQDTD